MERKPRASFLMWLVGDFTTKLELPRAFVQKYGEFLPHSAKLRTGSGATWIVKLDDNDDEYYFTEGWSNFAKYLKLSPFEFLVFWFNIDDSTFDVSVYGTNLSQRDISTHCQGSCVDKMIWRAEEECMDLSPTKTSVAHEKAIAFQSTGTFPNPVFTCVMQPSYVTASSYLNLPLRLVRQNLTANRTHLTLRLDNGKIWAVRCIIRQNYAKLSAGWKDFAIDNGLKAGDVCFFQMVNNAKDRVIWNVTIFRNPN